MEKDFDENQKKNMRIIFFAFLTALIVVGAIAFYVGLKSTNSNNKTEEKETPKTEQLEVSSE